MKAYSFAAAPIDSVVQNF